MEKLKFAAQVIVLLAAFPVLFVTGITRKEAAKADANNEAIVNHAPAVKKTVEKKTCICKSETQRYRGDKSERILKN
ncbi:MAG TPA: hypothetical protein VK489_07375 [Ferruginibacter sp.]|nr:hypothetical protein [Ferruginibacter sp.]